MMERRFTLSRKDRFSLGLTLVFKLFSQMEKVQTEAKDNDSEKGIPDKVGHRTLARKPLFLNRGGSVILLSEFC